MALSSAPLSKLFNLVYSAALPQQGRSPHLEGRAPRKCFTIYDYGAGSIALLLQNVPSPLATFVVLCVDGDRPLPRFRTFKRTIRAQSTRSWVLPPPAMATSPPPSCLCFELLGARAGDAVFLCGGERRHVLRLLSLRASRPRRLLLASFIPFTPTHPSSAELSSLKE